MKIVNNLAMEIIYEALYRNGYSNLGLAKAIRENDLTPQQRGRLTETVYGTLQNKLLLDKYIAKITKLNKVKPIVRSLVYVSAYQIFFMDNIPNHVITFESVNVMKQKKGNTECKYLNAVLRNLTKLDKSEIDKSIDFSTLWSHPKWIYELFLESYGKEKTVDMIKRNNEAPILSVRRNKLKCTKAEFESELLKSEIEFEKSKLAKDSYLIFGGAILRTSLFLDGYCIVQDQSASFVVDILRPKAGERVLDMCAAPGGKTTHMAEYMDNVGEIIAIDQHEHKLELINNNAKKLGIDIIETLHSDALELSEKFEINSFDKILLDPPCSGLGLLRRKPEIRYNKSMEDVYELSKVQRKMLDVAGELVKVGGTIIYSTCTLNANENNKNIERFLKKNENKFEVVKDDLYESAGLLKDEFGVTILTNKFISDGFYLCKLRKIQ